MASGAGGRAGVGPTGGARPDAGEPGAGGRAGRDAGVVGTGGGAGDCAGALTGDVLDPDDIYLAGTLQEGACYRDALANWACPNSAVTGFDCYFDGNAAGGTRPSAQIRPTDGRLIYTNTFEELIREFHCDLCPYLQGNAYPEHPLANDTVVPTDCELSQGRVAFLVSPTGVIVYYCPGAREWRDLSHKFIHSDDGSDPLLHLGYQNMALKQKAVVDLGLRSATPIKGLPNGPWDAIRAEPSGSFIVAIRSTETPESLWGIDKSGEATLRGQYPPLPASTSLPSQGQLEPGGALVQFAEGPGVFEDVIVRRTIDGRSDVVYSDARGPLVKIHISGLITGP
jgi:hypothetical protein